MSSWPDETTDVLTNAEQATTSDLLAIDPALLEEARRSTKVDVAQTGFNPALGRLPTIETQGYSLNTVLDFVPSWTARRIPMKCIGLTLPDGMEFMPPKLDTTTTSDGTQLRKIAPPKPEKSRA
jgi:hypothetical protein